MLPADPTPPSAAAPRSPLTKRLAWLALTLFAVSFLLPAYGTGPDAARGWACLAVCVQILDRNFLQSPGQLYYFGFTATNLLFCVLCVCRFRGARPTWLSRLGALLLLGHVLSWLILNLPPFSNGVGFMLRLGYFVWLAAFALLAVAELKPAGIRPD